MLGNGSGGGGRIAVYHRDATAFDLNTQMTALGGIETGSPNGQDGTVFEEQIIAMLPPTDGEAPIRKAAIESDKPVRLAALDHSLLGIDFLPTPSGRNPLTFDHSLLTKAQGSRFPGLQQLIADVQSRVKETVRPQRRVYSSNSVLSTTQILESLPHPRCRKG